MTLRHDEGRKPGKETEQLDIFKNEHVRKQTSYEYRRKKNKKKTVFVSRQNLSEQIQAVFFVGFLWLILRLRNLQKSICSDGPVCVTFCLDVFQDL